ncbi:MAG: thioredoxin family protein [Spirochaetes bacterium]|nr:thioredoxin family protein [Spirochaetota bacterium]
MGLFNDDVKKQLKEVLSNLENQVHLAFFTQQIECETCKTMHQFLDEMVSLSDKLNLAVYDFIQDKAKAEELEVDKIPAVVLLDKDQLNTRVRFFGIPGGYEINSFMNGLVLVSGKSEPLPAPLQERISKINQPVHIQTFVTLGCPYCPQAVEVGHRLAFENNHIKADMVETSTFPHLAVKYQVQGVPKTVINEQHELVGAHPLENVLELIEKI